MSSNLPHLSNIFGRTPLGILPLSRGTADRDCLSREDSQFMGRILGAENTRALVLIDGKAPVTDGRLQLVRIPQQIQFQYTQNKGTYELVYLGRTTEHHVVLLPLKADSQHLPAKLQNAAWLGLRDVAAALDDDSAGFFVEALAISDWLENHRFCPRCGSETVIEASGWQRRCLEQDHTIFPRTDPAIICTVVDAEDRLLLGAAKRWGGTRFSTLAGFVEPGESFEGAVVREVKEEANIDVADPEYLGSQPWPFPRSLMVGMTARALNPENIVPDGEEIIRLRWFTRDELAQDISTGTIQVPGPASIARKLIEHWYGAPLPEAAHLEN